MLVDTQLGFYQYFVHPLWIAILSGGLSGLIIHFLVQVLPENDPRKSIFSVDRFSPRFFIVIFATIVIAHFLYNLHGFEIGFFFGLVWMIYLFTILIIDIQYHRIIWELNLFGIGLGVLLGYINHGLAGTIYGGLFSISIFALLRLIGLIFLKKWSAVQNKSELDVIGIGDVVFSAVIGLWLGWPFIILGLLFSFGLLGIYGVSLIIIRVVEGKYKPYILIPFSPFMIVGPFLYLFIQKKLPLILSFLKI